MRDGALADFLADGNTGLTRTISWLVLISSTGGLTIDTLGSAASAEWSIDFSSASLTKE